MFDEECLALARHFYPNASEKFLYELAAAFQSLVEDRADDPDNGDD